MRVTATKLRQNVYAILDEVIEKGTPIEIERKGKILKIVPEVKPGKLSRIKPRPAIWVGDPNDIFKIGSMKDWHEPANLDALDREMGRKRKARPRTSR